MSINEIYTVGLKLRMTSRFSKTTWMYLEWGPFLEIFMNLECPPTTGHSKFQSTVSKTLKYRQNHPKLAKILINMSYETISYL